MLNWNKPRKARSSDEHASMYVADGAPPGCYVGNMSDEDALSWKAKKVGGDDPRVEIRTTSVRANLVCIVRPSGKVTISANSRWTVQFSVLADAVREAMEALCTST